MKVLLLYFAILLFISLRDFFKVKNFEDFVVAGRSQGLFFVTLSLLSTILGASATLGVCARAETEGFSAFWWLGFGAIGLLLQAFFLSTRIRNFKAKTLPDLVRMVVGKTGARLVALVIAVSWIGIIAAQLSGLGMFFNLLVQDASEAMILVASLLVILYTLLGGQLSVVKTDSLQFILFALGISGTFFFLFLGFVPEKNLSEEIIKIEFFGDKYSVSQWISYALTIVGAFLLGPDIVSRNLLSKSPVVARRASVIASISLALFGVLIACIGVWKGFYHSNEINPLLFLAEDILPLPLAVILCVGMVSALLSSADTSLINASSILTYDLIGAKKISVVRLMVLLLGGFATVLALRGQDIISLLIAAYSVYTPGVVCPLAVALLSYGKFRVVEKIWILGVVLGGSLGLLSVVLKQETGILPLIGMFVSLVVSLLGLRKISN